MKSVVIKTSTILLLLLFILTACSGDDQATPVPPATEDSEQAAATEPPPTAVPPTETPALATEPTVIPPADDPTAEPQGQELQSPLDDMAHTPDQRLINITWEWVYRDPNGNDITPITVPTPQNYTLLFNEDGTFNAVIDCNNASGQYATPDPGNIFMQLGPTTLAACPEGTLDAQMSQMFGPVQSYLVSDDGSTLTFNWAGGGPVDTFRNAALEIPGEEIVSEIPEDAIQLTTGALASSYQWVVVPGNPIPPGPGGTGFPAHIALTFDGQSLDEAVSNNSAILYIFPTEAYISMYNAAGNSSVADQVARLQELIDSAAGRQQPPEDPMPLLPPPQSFMGRWVQYSDLDFAVGKGLRYVSEAPNRQGIGPWTNLGTAYYYQGLTDDQNFYVSLRWPVSTSALPDSPDEVSDESLQSSTDPATYPTYLQETRDSLNALSAEEWVPDLTAIDRMIASLTLPTAAGDDGSAGEEDQDDEDVDLPDPGDGLPTGTVTAADGVFIRTGPGTEYPEVGAIAFQETGQIVGVSEDGQWWVFEVPAGLNAPNNQGWVSATFIDAQNTSDVAVIETPQIEPPLTGTTWGWVSTTSPVGVTTVNDPALYTILFNDDGSAAIKADCNNVSATYTSDGGSINIDLGPSTQVACAEGSLDQNFLSGLANVAVYFFQEGDLYMDLFADGGTMRFRAQPSTSSVPPPDGNETAETPDSTLGVASFGPQGSEQQLLPGTTITALFNDSEVSGLSGCNNYSGTLIPVDDHFTISPVTATQKECSEPAGIMDQEQAYLAALQAVNGFEWVYDQSGGSEVITAGQLFYTTAGGLPGVINLVSQ